MLYSYLDETASQSSVTWLYRTSASLTAITNVVGTVSIRYNNVESYVHGIIVRIA